MNALANSSRWRQRWRRRRNSPASKNCFTNGGGCTTARFSNLLASCNASDRHRSASWRPRLCQRLAACSTSVSMANSSRSSNTQRDNVAQFPISDSWASSSSVPTLPARIRRTDKRRLSISRLSTCSATVGFNPTTVSSGLRTLRVRSGVTKDNRIRFAANSCCEVNPANTPSACPARAPTTPPIST